MRMRLRMKSRETDWSLEGRKLSLMCGKLLYMSQSVTVPLHVTYALYSEFHPKSRSAMCLCCFPAAAGQVQCCTRA